MDATQALADLKEISSQIRAAVIQTAGGDVVGSTFEDAARAERLARRARELLEAAETAKTDGGRSTLVQLEAATAAGSVFVLRDEEHVISATTGPEPTVGLVFYDLKSALRSASPTQDKPAAPRAKPRRRKPKEDHPEEEKASDES